MFSAFILKSCFNIIFGASMGGKQTKQESEINSTGQINNNVIVLSAQNILDFLTDGKFMKHSNKM